MSSAIRHQKIVVESFGGPERLRLVEATTAPPRPGFARVRVLAAGVGATDAMARRGEYLLQRRRPFTPGYELIGQIVDHAAPPGQPTPDWLVPGARVAACLPKMGGYTEYRTLPISALVPVPDGLDTVVAAAIPLDYLTAERMITRHARVEPGDAVLIHGATGGVGDALCQLGVRRRLVLHGTASPRGIHLLVDYPITPIDYRSTDLSRTLAALLPGGVHAVFDHLGGASIREGYRLLAPGGTLVSYAFTGRPGHTLGDTVRGAVHNHLLGLRPGRRTALCSTPREIQTDRAWYRAALHELLELAHHNKIRPRLGPAYPLADAMRAHQELDRRTTPGKIVLTAA